MKHKRFVSLSLAATFLFCLLSVPASASAPVFPDMAGIYAWAAPYAEDLAQKGITQGYEDGRFHPENQLTAVEALTFCARSLQLSTVTKETMQADMGQQVISLLPNAQSWAVPEISVCLCAGILTINELTNLCGSGAISSPITKEDLAMYLVRTMQLEPQAQSLTSYSLSYADNLSISDTRQPYVYLLTRYRVVEGTDRNTFDPQSYVNRAVMATMISRAMKVMSDQNIITDLPAYENYHFVGGVVRSITTNSNATVTMRITSAVRGTMDVTMASNTPVYLDRIGTSVSAIAEGQYAKVVLDDAGRPVRVLLNSSVSSYTGEIVAISQESITILANGASRTFKFDRCTEIETPLEKGDVSVILPTETYDEATVQVTSAGLAVSAVLSSASIQITGIMGDLNYTENGTIFTLHNFDGTSIVLPLVANAAVTVDGVNSVLRKTDHVGFYAMITLDEENGKISAVSIDTTRRYVQGYIYSTITLPSKRISISQFDSSQSREYPVKDDAPVKIKGQTNIFAALALRDIVTVQLDETGTVTSIDSYPSLYNVEGTIETLNLGPNSTLTLRNPDNIPLTFQLNTSDLPTITRDNQPSTWDRLTEGDAAVLTVRYNTVTSVVATSQDATIEGMITSIVTDFEGTALNVQISSGEVVSYRLADQASILYHENAVALNSLRPGDTVAMVVNHEKVTAVRVLAVTQSSSDLEGVILSLDLTNRTILLQLAEGTAVTVSVPVGVSIVNPSAEVGTLTFEELHVGERLTVYGDYSDSQFAATFILRQ